MGSNLQLYKEDYLPHQWEFLTIQKRQPEKKLNFLCGGMGSGKTFIFLHKCLINHVTKKNSDGISNGWVIYPTYSLAEELFVEPMKDIFDRNGIKYTYNVQKHRFQTPYGVIKIYQLQTPHRLIGANLNWVGIDEFDLESWKNCDIAYKKAIGRLRGSENTELFIVSTPEGFSYLHHISVEKANEHTYLVRGKTTDNPYLPESYINLLETNYDSTLLKAYRDGEFVNISALSTYYSFERSKNVKKCEYDRSLPLCVSIDWNVDPMCVCLLQEKRNGQVQVFDEVILSHQGQGDLISARMCAMIKDKYPNSQYIAYPDASGFQRHTSAQFSDIDILKQHGFTVKVRKTNPPVVNRVNAVNRLLALDNKMLEGKQLIIDPKCKTLIQDLEKVTNKQGTRDIDKSNKLLTHSSDALGYYISFEHPIIKPTLGAIER